MHMCASSSSVRFINFSFYFRTIYCCTTTPGLCHRIIIAKITSSPWCFHTTTETTMEIWKLQSWTRWEFCSEVLMAILYRRTKYILVAAYLSFPILLLSHCYVITFSSSSEIWYLCAKYVLFRFQSNNTFGNSVILLYEIFFLRKFYLILTFVNWNSRYS